MGRTAAVVSDPTDMREFDCLLPDDVPVGEAAARFAELAGFPAADPDGNAIAYTFVAKGGYAIDPDAILADIDLPEPLALRIVPELTIGSGEGDLFAGIDEPEPVVELGEERCRLHDEGLHLRFDVRLEAAVHHEIEEFASRDRYAECAGLLLGDIAVERKARVANVRAIAPAHGAVETRTSVRLTLEAWESMLGLRDREHSDLRVLGWFHTHAGWGVFLSDMDVFVQSSFFAHPNMLAYVIDPTSGHESFFLWKDGRIVQSPTYGLVGAPKQSASVSKPARIGKRTLAASAAGLVLAGGLYLGVCTLHAPPKPAPPPVAQAERTPLPKPADRTITLAKGDNLWDVCIRVYDDGDLAPALAKYNGIDDLNGIQIGQRIKLPPKTVLAGAER